jgi:hypothetical protein
VAVSETLKAARYYTKDLRSAENLLKNYKKTTLVAVPLDLDQL